MTQVTKQSAAGTFRTADRGPTNVLIVDHGLSFGGTVVVAAMLLRNFEASRVRACFVTAAADDFAKARLVGNYDVHFAGPRFNYAGEAKLKERLAVVRLDAARQFLNRIASAAANLLNLRYVWRLLKLARSRKVQVIHCNNSVNAEAVLVAMLLRLPCVFHVHGIGVPGRFHSFLVSLVPRHFVAISEAVRHALQAGGIANDDITMIYNPVELPAGSPGHLQQLRLDERAALGVGETAVVAGIVGRVVRWKGQAEFLRACRLAFASSPTLHAVIVGDASDLGDDYFAALKADVELSGYADRIHFRGFVDDPDRIYAALDILVHSSIEPEPFGLVITEAMVRGIPVVVADTGAPPELVEHGVTGFVQNPRDVSGVAARLVELAESQELRERIGTEASAAVVQRHDVHQYANQMAAVYERLAAKS